jgi:hypothetical protein
MRHPAIPKRVMRVPRDRATDQRSERQDASSQQCGDDTG